MKKETIGDHIANEVIRAPGFPTPGNKLFEQVGAAVTAAKGYPLSNRDFARLMGKSESTVSAWFGYSSQPHLIAWVSLLEHLPPEARHRVVDGVCRDLPRLEHPGLSHDPITVGALEDLIRRKSGLTFITGGTDSQRTFLVTALGHSFSRIDPEHRIPSGLDFHEPRWFVPVEGVIYIRCSRQPEKTDDLVRRIWSEVRSQMPALVLLNGIQSGLQKIWGDLLTLTAQRHVIIAEAKVSPVLQSALDSTAPVNRLTVSLQGESTAGLSVDTWEL